MAARKALLKLNHIEAVYKFVNDVDGAASLTVDLDVDLLKSNEQLNGEVVKVAIGAIEAEIATNKEVTVTRNGVVIMNMFENTNTIQLPYGADRENSTFDITVNFTGKGTIYMRLLKAAGFRPVFRPEQNGGL